MDPKRLSDVFPAPLRLLYRIAVVLVLDAVALLILSELLTNFTLDGPAAALGAAALVGVLNSLVWPVVARVTLPLSVLTLGAAAVLLNAALVTGVIELIPGAEISGFREGVVVTVGIALLTALGSALLAIDDDESWRRNVVGRQLRLRGGVNRSEVPGVLFCEIDGLAHEVLQRALRDGTAPNIARWVRNGSHRLHGWETDLSSQTGACQAGLLHGDNFDMPAFRWWEKDRGAAIVTNHPRDAAEIERRHSDGRGLLHADGASRANILSGDAPHTMLTMSTVLSRRLPLGTDYAGYFAQPYAAVKSFGAAVAEVARERRAAARQRRRGVEPRIERSRTYALMRAWATVVQLDLQVAAVVGDLLAGRPTVYTTFLAYDEVAHHSGIERADTLAVLAKVDQAIGRIALALEEAPRPYELVVLSDHGQSQGSTFLRRYGVTLEEVVTAASRADEVRVEIGGGDEAAAFIGAGITERSRGEGAAAAALSRATRERRDEAEAVVLEPPSARAADGADKGDLPEISVMASGCLGLVSFPREPGRVSLERLEALHPALIPTLCSHPGIGFVMVRNARGEAMVLGGKGRLNLSSGELSGADPLEPFGPNAARHLRRTDGFPNCPDLLLNSTYWPETDEVAAFEELVGSHGGIGGPQSRPFVCHPAGLKWPDEPVVGAEAVHRIFRGWLTTLGHRGYEPGAPSAADETTPGGSTSSSTSGATAES
ncbi:MAG: phage holin family protein [Solirubrobacterales bacterium]